MINEVLTKSTPAGEWIKDFVDSDNPKFAGKSAAKRKQMALAAYYAKKNESVEEAAAVSQNSTAMQDMNEDHLVHVNDGSKYDEQPHEKDVEHVMAGVKLHGGEHAGASDKGVFFKFKSPEHASSFISHVNKCPHRSCDAHMSEAVEYKGIGTDVVDKKKKLNPQPNFTTDKKTVKDFKEAKELDKACWKGYKAIGLKNKNGRQVPNCVPEEKELEEAKVYDPFTKKMVPTKPIKVQAGGGATKNGVPVETGPSKYKQSLKKEEVELIDELSKDTLASYAKKASHDARIKQHVAADFKSKAVHARVPRKKENWKSLADKYQSQAWKREKGHDKAVDKLKEEVEHLDEAKYAIDVHHKKLHKMLDHATKSGIKAKVVAHNPNWEKQNAGGEHIVHLHGKEEHVRKYIQKHYDNDPEATDDYKEYGKSVKEEVQINESSLHRQHFQMVADLIRGHESAEKRKELAHHHAELFKKANPRFDHAKFMKAAGVNEEVQIDEISKSTLARYIPSAARDVGSHTYAGKESGEWASHYTRAGDWSAAEKHSKKSYADFKKANKRVAGIDRATKKLATQKEEIELDESKGLSHALVQAGKSKWHIYDTKTREVHSTYNNKNVAMKKYGELNDKHAGYDSPGGLVRSKYGVRQEPMRKEEVELDEAIAKKLPVQHAVDAVHKTLGPKSATRFLSHLSPGSDKHTSWDKVNDALVKQGVQTHHIASIAQKTSHMNEAYTDKEYQSAMNAYLKKGGKVETLPARKPRPSEKTFINRTGSIWKKGYTKSAVSGFNNKSQTTVDDRNKHIREESVEESRGHKVLATFFKNREVAQRAYQGNPARDSEVAAGGGSPAEQGIAAAKRDAEELKKKVAESRTPAVHAALPKKTKSTAKEYDKASIPGTKRVARAKPDDNEVGGGTATRIAEDQYTSEYKIKSYVDPVTGENKTRKIRPHRINFKSSKMNAAPAQMTEPTKVTEDDKVYDEKWKKVKFTDFIKGAK